jgi:2-dehydro-3-deoxyphosphooctonate aldolase (KDO 8-P synthase)
MIPKLDKLKFQDNKNFFLIAGPCVIEDDETPFIIAERLVKVCNKFEIPLIFKASYKKGNRSRLDSFTGIGDFEGLKIIERIGKEFDIPTTTDIHTDTEVVVAAEYVDVLQIPAFLCRQTELLLTAAATGKYVNIKKGQFLSAKAMTFAIDKIKSSKNTNIMLTERGTTFGYQDLVVDYRSIPIMQKNECPVLLDITHSLQQPNQHSGITGGQPELINIIAQAGIAAGADGIYMETHPNPSNAKSDGENMLLLDHVEDLLQMLVRIPKAIV